MHAPADLAAPADRNAGAALDVPAAAQSPNSAGKGLRNNRIDVATLRGRPRGVLHPADLQLPDWAKEALISPIDSHPVVPLERDWVTTLRSLPSPRYWARVFRGGVAGARGLIEP